MAGLHTWSVRMPERVGASPGHASFTLDAACKVHHETGVWQALEANSWKPPRSRSRRVVTSSKHVIMNMNPQPHVHDRHQNRCHFRPLGNSHPQIFNSLPAARKADVRDVVHRAHRVDSRVLTVGRDGTNGAGKSGWWFGAGSGGIRKRGEAGRIRNRVPNHPSGVRCEFQLIS